jgi:hypothetical protein
LNLLPKPAKQDESDQRQSDYVEYSIEETYTVPREFFRNFTFRIIILRSFMLDVGPVVGGILLSGQISVHSGRTVTYYLGPDRGRFVPIRIYSVHRQRCPVIYISEGQAATCAITFVKEKEFKQDADGDEDTESYTPPNNFRIRKGQVIVSSIPENFKSSTQFQMSTSPMTYSSSPFRPTSMISSSPSHPFGKSEIINLKAPTAGPVWEFEADIHIVQAASSTGIPLGYQSTVYIGSIRQCAKIVKLRDDGNDLFAFF